MTAEQAASEKRVRYAPWARAVVQGVADALGDTESGLTGAQIEALLETSGLGGHDPGKQAGAKRTRLFTALWNYQAERRAANGTIAVITQAMHPAAAKDPAQWETRKEELNEVLAYVGCHVREDGQVGRGDRARTRADAMRLADSVRGEAQRRGCHPNALAACAPEAVQRNWFHASLEAVKGVMVHLRERTGSTLDGASLVDAAMGGSTPPIKINDISTSSEHNEQTGLADIIKGVVKMYRHPVAHDSARERAVTREDFLDLLAVLSMVYRRLEA